MVRTRSMSNKEDLSTENKIPFNPQQPTELTLLQEQLSLQSSEKYAQSVTRFFKVGKGGYSEHDQFIGVSLPGIRSIAKQYGKNVAIKTITSLLDSPIHEERLLGLVILVQKYEKGTTQLEKKSILDVYFRHLNTVNNWDLVDLTAHKIFGHYLFHYHSESSLAMFIDINHSERGPLELPTTASGCAEGFPRLLQLSRSTNIWERRIAAVSTLYFIQKGSLDIAFQLATLMQAEDVEILGKAVGWILKEAGKRNPSALLQWLEKHWDQCHPRIVRVAVEKLPPTKKKKYLQLLKRK